MEYKAKITVSLSVDAQLVMDMDKAKGEKSRNKYIVELIKKAVEESKNED